MDERTFNKEVFGIIEPALEAAGYTVLEGDEDTAYLLAPNRDVRFMIQITHLD